MNVNSVSISSTSYEKIETSTVVSTQAVVEEKVESEINPVEMQTDNEEEIAVGENDKTRQKGVIRNLLNGHFKGVADVRLRINFADEIEVIEKEQAITVYSDSFTNLGTTVDSKVETIASNTEIGDQNSALLTTAYGSFQTSLSASIENVKSGDQSGEEAIATLRTAFGEFVASATPIPVEEPVEEEPPVVATENLEITDSMQVTVMENPLELEVEPIVSETSPDEIYNQLLSDLIGMFENELAQIEEHMETFSVLPEISEPNGNGKAFAKFMAIYNNLQTENSPETTVEPTPSEPVESSLTIAENDNETATAEMKIEVSV